MKAQPILAVSRFDEVRQGSVVKGRRALRSRGARVFLQALGRASLLQNTPRKKRGIHSGANHASLTGAWVEMVALEY